MLFKRETVQQVRMEKKCPSRDGHPFAVVFLASDLSGSDTQKRSFVVVVLAAAIVKHHIGIIPEKQGKYAVIVQTVAYRRHLGIVDDTDQGMLFGASQVAAVVIDALDFQYRAHIFLPVKTIQR